MNKVYKPLDYHSIDNKLTEILEYGEWDETRSEYYSNYEELICEMKNLAADIFDRAYKIVQKLDCTLPYKNVNFYSEDDNGSGIAWFNTCVALFEDLDMTMLLLNEDEIDYYEEIEDEMNSISAQIEAHDKRTNALRKTDNETYFSTYTENSNKRSALFEKRAKIESKLPNKKTQRINAFRKLTKDQMILCYTLVTNFVFDYLRLESAFDAVKACIDELDYNNSFYIKNGEVVTPDVAWVI